MFQVNGPFGSGEKVQNRFSTWRLWRPYWITDWNDFSYFYLQVTPILPIKFGVNCVFVLFFFRTRKKFKIDFQDGDCGDNLGFPIGTTLAIFDLQVTPILPTTFRVILPFISGECKIDFQDGGRGGQLRLRIGTIYFDLQVTLILPTKFRITWPIGSREEIQYKSSRWRGWLSFWISIQNDFTCF